MASSRGKPAISVHPRKIDETTASVLPADDEAAFAWTLAVIEQAYRMRKPEAHRDALQILAKHNLTVAGLAKRAKVRRKAGSSVDHIERVAAAYQDRAEALGALIETASSKRTLLNEDAGPTPQTILRPTRRDPIEALYNAGHLTGAEVDAARQIAIIYEALTKPLLASAQAEMPIVKAPKKSGRRTNAGMPDWIADLRATVYLPWARDVVTRTFRYCRGCGASVRASAAGACPRCRSTSIGAVRGSLPLVLDVVVDGLALDRAMRQYRLGTAKALAALAGALRRYVEIRNDARRGEG